MFDRFTVPAGHMYSKSAYDVVVLFPVSFWFEIGLVNQLQHIVQPRFFVPTRCIVFVECNRTVAARYTAIFGGSVYV